MFIEGLIDVLGWVFGDWYVVFGFGFVNIGVGGWFNFIVCFINVKVVVV